MPVHRVVVVDDHRAFAEAVSQRLSLEPDISVAGVCATERETLIACRSLRPDIVTIDVMLGDHDGIALAAQLRHDWPQLGIVFLTATQELSQAVRAIRAGGNAWVEKDMPIEHLLRVIRGVANGETWLPPHLLTGVLAALLHSTRQQESSNPLDVLSQREREIIRLLSSGLDRQEIARRLYLSPNTVRTHIRNALVKLDVHSSLEAAAVYRSVSLVDEPTTTL
ncbi:MAG TPA: response regulator transcription factor [Mycobacteriales bacterium]|nr:response regulator transcription factor [Mycobacteriales bacterium]